MLKIAVIAGAATVSAVLAAQGVIMVGRPAEAAPPPVMARAVIGEPSSPTAAAQPASIRKSADGHFWAQASVNGTAVKFLVDTGATAVALTPADALRLGFAPAGLDFNYKVQTASGEARAARIELASVAVSGARITDVEAYVIERGLDDSLLGMSYLGRLSRFEATRDSLVLRP